MSEGGTTMYCPNCQKDKVCRSIGVGNFGEETYFGNYKDEQRRNIDKYPDLSFFMRGRECQTCQKKFLTVEIHENALNELVRLRAVLEEIKHKAIYLPTVEEATNLSEFLQYLDKLD